MPRRVRSHLVTRSHLRPGGLALAVAAVLAAAAPLPGAGAGRPSNPRAQAVRKVFPSAARVRITAAGEVVRSASAIAFASEGGRSWLLTNAHVVDPNKSWRTPVVTEVLRGDGSPLRARVVARGRVPDADLALLEVEAELPVTPLAADDELELGEDLVVIGAPFGKALSVAAGIVSQIEYEFAENAAAPRLPKALKTDAAIGYGSSGGGVFDVARGRLVGLVEGYRTARVAFGSSGEEQYLDVPMPGETFVAPAAKIRRFLAESGYARLAPGPVAPGAAAAGL